MNENTLTLTLNLPTTLPATVPVSSMEQGGRATLYSSFSNDLCYNDKRS